MKNIYEAPELIVIKFETDDVIVTSQMGTETGGSGGETGWPT